LAKIREQLTDWVGKARVVLTCRLNVWDATISNTLTDFETYKTLEFEPNEVDEFIRQWFEEASQDEKRRKSGNESFWHSQGKRLQQQLKAPGKERIRELVRNPLRLSMLCQSWCVAEEDLPETKAALYEQFTTYFFEWKQEEFQKKHRVLKETDKKQIQQALAKLALAAMESANRFRIEQQFAIEQMEEQWFDLADELGWLVLVDRDTRTKKPVYAFYHPTFQEYFAACAIEDWHYFLDHQLPPVSDCYRIFERQWREVILLWLGRGEIEAKKKQEFIDALVNFEDGYGKGHKGVVNKYLGRTTFIYFIDKGLYEYRAYFLATLAIAEVQDYSLIDEIIGKIVKWVFGYFDIEEQNWVAFRNIITNTAREALQQTHRPKALAALVKLLNSPNLNDYIRMEVAESLGEIDPGNQKAIDTLVKLLSSPHLDDDTRMEVVERLGNIGHGNQNAIDALVQLLNSSDLDDDTRMEVAESLWKIDPGNQKAIDTLVQLLSFPDLDYYECWQAASSLEKIGQGNQNAIDALVQLLISPHLGDGTRMEVAESLGNIGIGNQNAINALGQRLKSPNLDNFTSWLVAESLLKIDPGNKNARDALVQLLKSPNLDYSTRWRVAYSLLKIDPGNNNARDDLVQLLNSPDFDNSTPWRVASSLGNIGHGNQNAIDAFVQLLKSRTLDDSIRWRVASSLGNIDPGNYNAIEVLVQQLKSPHLDDYTCREVAESLRNIGHGNQNAIDALVQLLNSPHLDDDTRSEVAESLGNIGHGNQNAIDALVQLLNSGNLDDDTRWQVASNLGKIDPGNQNAIDALLQLLNSGNLDDDTRWQVVSSLGKIGQGNQKVIHALVQLLNSDQLDGVTRMAVAKSLKEIDTDKKFAVITALTAKFNNSQQIDWNCYELIWHYAQNLPYPDFYQAWHQDTLSNTVTASHNIANLPQYLAEAINNQPELCSKVKLICIDTHQFIEPENPAPEIYDEMQNQNCPEWQNGYPDTMQKLKLYWNSLRRQSEIPLFFICYDSTALSATPTGFRDSFLKALSKFDRAICIVCETEDIPLQTFSPSQPDLVAAVVAWIRRSILENRQPI